MRTGNPNLLVLHFARGALGELTKSFILPTIARSPKPILRHSHEFDNLEDFASELPAIMKEPGPVFVCLKVDHPNEQPPVYIGKPARP